MFFIVFIICPLRCSHYYYRHSNSEGDGYKITAPDVTQLN